MFTFSNSSSTNFIAQPLSYLIQSSVCFSIPHMAAFLFSLFSLFLVFSAYFWLHLYKISSIYLLTITSGLQLVSLSLIWQLSCDFTYFLLLDIFFTQIYRPPCSLFNSAFSLFLSPFVLVFLPSTFLSMFKIPFTASLLSLFCPLLLFPIN